MSDTPMDASLPSAVPDTEVVIPKKRVVRKRSTAAKDALPDAAVAIETPALEAAQADPVGLNAEEAPKRRRTRVVKSPEAVSVEPATADLAQDVVPAAKPARRTRKPAASAPVLDESPAVSVVLTDASPEPVVPMMSAEPAAAQFVLDPVEAAPDRRDEGGRGPRAKRTGGRQPRRPREDRPQSSERFVQPAAAADDDVQEPALPSALTTTDARQVFEKLAHGEWPEAAAEADATEVADLGKRVLLPDPTAPKLQKVLAQSGVGSRRDMEQWIAEGLVTVNGEPAHVGQRISYGDRIAIKGKPVRVRIDPPQPRLLAYHKPTGEVVTREDPQQRPTVFQNLPHLPQGKWLSVGRLDINTEGLLLFTNSGDLANQLMHPRFGVEREYAVRVLGSLDDESRGRLLTGVDIEGQVCAFKSIEDGGGDGANRWYRVIITEGRNREVRKLFGAVGLAVSRLMRIRYASVVLPHGLRRGVWVELNSADVHALTQMTGLDLAYVNKARRSQFGGRPGARIGQQRGPDMKRDRPAPGGNGAAPNQAGAPPFENQANSAGNKAGRAKPQRGRGGQGRNEKASNIPNPLMQTYDTRAIQDERRQSRIRVDDDDHFGAIPNPLEQTYDKRFVQNRTVLGAKPGKRATPGGQPDPMQTSVGYIGADAFHKKMIGRGRRRG